MKIAIDLRSLQSGSVSGVENYTLNLTQALLKLDRQNQYILFYNSWRQAPLAADFHYVNARLARTSIPNKLLNVFMKVGVLKLHNLIGEFDVLFMPNINQISLRAHDKLLLTVHDLSPIVAPEFYDIKRRLWHRFVNFNKNIQRANGLVAVSEYTKRDIVRVFKTDEEKINVAYPGIDHSCYKLDIPVEKQREVRNTYNLPRRYIIFVNTLEPRKNLHTLLKAFEMTAEPVHLVIAGKLGWKSQKLMRRLKSGPIKQRVHWLGYVKEQDKPALIKLSEALVYPSLYEGFGFQPLEAAALGVPVVASQVTSIPEVIGDAALLVNPYSAEDLAKAINEVLTNMPLREELINKGLKRANEFTWESTARAVLSQLQSLK